MSDQPWETHDHLCSRRHPQVAYPRRACPECRAVEAARAEGYAAGLIEGDHGGRREGYRIGYDAGKDAVMTASYAQAVAEGHECGTADGYAAALDRARDAVAAAELRVLHAKAEALAAIDALRGAE